MSKNLTMGRRRLAAWDGGDGSGLAALGALL